ncbi:hypothetical protein Q7P37_008757 [Cladosporium fusiforme]
MARGNQREKAREAAQKKAGNVKNKTTATGSQQAADKEKVAAIMLAKQKAAEAKKAEAAAGGDRLFAFGDECIPHINNSLLSQAIHPQQSIVFFKHRSLATTSATRYWGKSHEGGGAREQGPTGAQSFWMLPLYQTFMASFAVPVLSTRHTTASP